MEVTCENFNDVLPEIERVINNCTFLSIDCEFSGLQLNSEINAFDTPKQYYEKIRKNCKDFLVLQYGICAFRFNQNDNEFKQQSYNFYIFRKPVNRNIPDQRFLCQTSSINFLITNCFDFNKLFKFGIPYLNISEEATYRKTLEENQINRQNSLNPRNSSDNIRIPDDVRPFIDQILGEIDDFLKTERDEVELPKSNAFVRRLIYQTVNEKYSGKILLRSEQKNGDRILVAAKFKDKKQQEEIEKKILDDSFKLLDNYIGFSKIMKLIVNSGKLVVGHNMCLDFFHTIDKFLTPLSESYDEFKECAHSLFSKIIDTKYMSSSEPFTEFIQSTVLKDMLTSFSKAPFQIPTVKIENDGQGYSLSEEKEHEAGYDAYITGLSFITMWNYLGKIAKLPPNQIFVDFRLLEPYQNRIFLMILRDNQYIHLGGNDSNPSREHVFYLTFPKEWKLNNILQLFSPFGNVYVAWINESSAFVGLTKKEQAAVALSTLSQSDTYSITTFANRQAQMNKIDLPSSLTAGLSNTKKRPYETMPQSRKKLKTNSGQSFSMGFETIVEEPVECVRSTTKKTFVESDWD